MYPFAEINYAAVVVSALVAMFIGSLWYGPIFGKSWMKMAGLTIADMKKGGKKMVFVSMGIMFVACLVTSFALGQIFAAQGFIDLKIALWMAAFIWFAFQLPILIGVVLWEMKPWKLFFLNAAYQLLAILVAAAIMSTWL